MDITFIPSPMGGKSVQPILFSHHTPKNYEDIFNINNFLSLHDEPMHILMGKYMGHPL
jgi:hypothetical protein